MGRGSLKDNFPHIFALARYKIGPEVNFGKWVSSRWHWELELRHRLFGWGQEHWDELVKLLDDETSDN